MTFKKLAAEVLQKAQQPLAANEIWQRAVSLHLDQALMSVGKTPAATLAADLYRDTKNEDSKFLRIGSRPRRFWLKTRALPVGAADEPAVAPEVSSAGISEADLHPLLALHADQKMGGLLVRTIRHVKSKKKSYGEWVHPDIVGVFFPERELSAGTLKLSSALHAPLCKLYSFELKLRVGFDNLRESFFQAVSNSSWANEGYLVAAEFEADPEFREELDRLCSAFGIGIIQLSTEDPGSSEVLIPPSVRPELDWATVDKLADMNPDFANFIQNVCADLVTGVHPKEYDAVPADAKQYAQAANQKIK